MLSISLRFTNERGGRMKNNNEIKITQRSRRWGTYATTTYYIDCKEFHTITENKNNCGTDWFNSLPETQDDNKATPHEDITGNTPYWLDDMILKEVEDE